GPQTIPSPPMSSTDEPHPHDRVARFALGPFMTNCYVLRGVDDASCWIIDAGLGPDVLIDHVRSSGLEPRGVILTHAHADHIGGLDDVREAFPGVPVSIHPEEAPWLDDPESNLSNNFGLPMRFAPAERTIEQGDTLGLAGEEWGVLHTPGHSPGSVSLYNAELGICFAGDTLFHGSIGRFDFPTSDGARLFASIREKLYTLPDTTLVLPGHGPETMIEYEKLTNPHVRPE
ncbi:MAG: MBL fold metallo-hydrolase, partial [Planctomycetota bacterium]